MQRTTIPNTELNTSRLGFGTASLHHLFRSQDRKALLAVALDSGFTHFDTAPMYGEGMAERELGRFLGSARNRVTIATKIGYPAIAMFEHYPPLLYVHRVLGKVSRRILPSLWNYRPKSLVLDDVERSLTRSMKALRTDWIDLLLVHEPQVSDVVALLGLSEWLEGLKTSGRARYIGLAGSAPNCVEVVRQIPDFFDVLQVEDSLEEHEANIMAKNGWPLQVTYGYMRRAAAHNGTIDAHTVIKESLERNADGMVLVSSCNPERLKVLASIAELDRNEL